MKISEQITPADEIIIVDQNEFSPPCLSEITGRLPQVRHLKIRQKGLPNARNIGVSEAKAEIIIFCDDDVIPSDDFINSHKLNYDDPGIAGVAGRVLGNGSRLSETSATSNQRKIAKIRWPDLKLFDNFDAAVRTAADHAQGCNMSFRKDIIFELGGFDLRFSGSAYLEETDFCIRLRKAGHRMVFDPSAELIHLKEKTGGCRSKDWRKWFYWYGHNYALLYFKNNKSITACLAFQGMHLLVSALKRTQLSLFFEGLKGMRDGFAAAYFTH